MVCKPSYAKLRKKILKKLNNLSRGLSLQPTGELTEFGKYRCLYHYTNSPCSETMILYEYNLLMLVASDA